MRAVARRAGERRVMTVVKIIVLWGGIAIGAAVLAALIAGARNRDHSAWAAWCFIFPPLLIILALLPRNTGPKRRRPSLDEEDSQEAA